MVHDERDFVVGRDLALLLAKQVLHWGGGEHQGL